MTRVEAVRNAGSADTWTLTVHIPGSRSLVLPHATWDLVERALAQYDAPQRDTTVDGSALTWVVSLILLPGPMFWLGFFAWRFLWG